VSLATVHELFGTRPNSVRVVGVAVAAAALAGSLAQLAHGGIAGSQSGSTELDWIGVVLAACSTVPLVAWRSAPRAVFVVTALAAVLLSAFGYPLTLALGPAVALFLLAASRDEQEPWTRRDTATVGALFFAYLAASALGDGRLPASELLHTGLAWAVAWFAGDRTRLRHEQIVDLAQRALRSEREAERERLLAVAQERARIARDLHDSAGHAINVIAMRAGTARLRRDPARSQAALEAIEELARKTVGEIDQIVGTLREQDSTDDAVEVPPGLAFLDTLVERHAASGLDVSFTRAGAPRELERTVDQAAYRIVQEALTNAARHGTGTAEVEIRFADAVLDLSVANASADEPARRSNGGHGLIGMRERAVLLGGSFDADHVDGVFRVRAQLPYTGVNPFRAS
jgi:signal transduction histidine kinase